MNARLPVDELAQVIRRVDGHHTMGAGALADAILAAGYSKPKVLGYIVVTRAGVVVGQQHKYQESAQADADKWTKDCESGGVDWDYRVATITEAAA